MHLYVFIYNAFFPNIFLQSQYFFAVPLHLLNDTLNQNYHPPQPLNHQAAPITTVQTHTAIHLFIAMLPCSKELLQNTWLGKNHSRNEWLIRDWSPERAQKRCSYLGFSWVWPDPRALPFHVLLLLLINSRMSSTEPTHSVTRVNPQLRMKPWSYTSFGTFTNIFLPAPAPQRRVALALRHIPSSRETLATTTHRRMG